MRSLNPHGAHEIEIEAGIRHGGNGQGDITFGERVRIAHGVVLGSPGFGYEKEDGEWKLRGHPFGVVLGDDVEIGANTVIDRGRYRDTEIGAGTKIDALVFIAHNVIVGKRCIIIANAMIAGSCEIGDDVWIGPGAQISDHIKIGHAARIGMGAVVLRDVPAGETWVGNPAKRLRSKDEAGGLQRLEQLLDLDRPGVEWRHDVDYDLTCAIAMAEFEAKKGIRSTYYFLPRSPDYALKRSTIEIILAFGHDIGTHVDLHVARDATFTDEQLQAACVEDYQRLTAIAGRGITRRVSFHQLPLHVLWRDVPGFLSAHAPRWKGNYVGDSRGVFEVNPEERLRLSDGSTPLQINLHPEWWFLSPREADIMRQREAANP